MCTDDHKFAHLGVDGDVLREAERRGWVKVKYAKDKPDIYSATRKGRIMDENRE
jgi:hypothetical protein